MKDQGKISELNKSSHRDQTSFSVGLMSALLSLLWLVMGIHSLKPVNPNRAAVAHKYGNCKPQSSKKRKREIVKTTKPEAHKAEVKVENDPPRSNSRKAGTYAPQSGISPDDGAKFLGKVTPKSGLPPDKPASQDAPGITTVLNGLPNAVSRVAPPKPPKPSRKDPNDGFLNGFSVGL